MADATRLKNRARREEQRHNWSRAIELYTRALQESESAGASVADLSLYNRIGDIYLRQGHGATAVEFYERAVARYREQELYTSAVALCHKVLRISGERVGMHLELARLHLETGLLAEARICYQRYASEMRARGSPEVALEAVEECVERTDDADCVTDLSLRLVEELGRAGAIPRLQGLLDRLSGNGRARSAVERELRRIEADGTVPAPADAEEAAIRLPRHSAAAKAMERIEADLAGETANLISVEAELADAEGRRRVADPNAAPTQPEPIVEPEPNVEAPEQLVAEATEGGPARWPEPEEWPAARTAVPRRESLELPASPACGGWPGEPLHRASRRHGAETSERPARFEGVPATRPFEPLSPDEREAWTAAGAAAAVVRKGCPVSAESSDPRSAATAGVPGRPRRTPIHLPSPVEPRLVLEPIHRLPGLCLSGGPMGPEAPLEAGPSASPPFRHPGKEPSDGVVDGAVVAALCAWQPIFNHRCEPPPRPISPGDSPVRIGGPTGTGRVSPDPSEREMRALSGVRPRAASSDVDGQEGCGGETSEGPSGPVPAPPEREPPVGGRPADRPPHPILAERREPAVAPGAVRAGPVMPRFEVLESGSTRESRSSVCPVELEAGEVAPAGPGAGHYERGMEHRAAGRVSEARAEFELALQSPRDFADAYNALRESGTLTPRPEEAPGGRAVEGRFTEISGSERAAAEPDEDFRHWMASAGADVLRTACEELERRGETRKARLVIERLLELNPDDDDARRALEVLGVSEPAQVANAAGVDESEPDEVDSGGPPHQAGGGARGVGAYVGAAVDAGTAGRHSPRSTPGDRSPRRSEPIMKDETGSFEEVVAELKSRLAENETALDTASRTRMGISLKEMGLLDDAIRELQLAVREPNAPVEAFELLGEAFIEKGQPRVAARFLSDALNRLTYADSELLGVLYQLGVAYQQVNDPDSAVDCYERIFSVDIDYRDVKERIIVCSR
ncbi:MAG: tetratricopeptide repeat protein [Gemmatimonadota bacterium]